MKKPSFLTLALVLVLLIGPQASATTRSVPGEYPNIQAAIGASNHGDTVIVQPGRYCENINFLGKAITVTSTNPADPNIVRSTIIDGGGAGSVVSFDNQEKADSVLAGFTITNGYAFSGGGIHCTTSAPTITNCIITNNIAENDGGGIYNSPGPLNNCIISVNTAGNDGGGICWVWGPVRNCIISGNSAGHEGGGLCWASSFISNCTIVNNTVSGTSLSWPGGGIAESDEFSSNCIITNCIIWGNQPDQVRHRSHNWHHPDPFWKATRITYSCVDGILFGTGNISDDPMFVDPDADDYRLQVGSPCINAGDPNFAAVPNETDMEGQSRVLAGRVDMGADEFGGNMPPIAKAGQDQSMNSIPAVITLDGSGSFDLNGNTLTCHWRQTAGPAVDLSDANAVAPKFTPVEFGAYVFELVVNDGYIDSLPDTVSIVVGIDRIPVADAGSTRYAADKLAIHIKGVPVPVSDYVVLDGDGSYDPDGSGTLTYQWRQVSGPALNITGENTVTPAISGFDQTDSVQVCEFELTVSDGEYHSAPDTVEVIIVQAPNASTMVLENDSGTFDPDKPTTIYFAASGDPWFDERWDHSLWQSKANVISFSRHEPDRDDGTYTYARVGDMIIAYLSSVAPNYVHQIQVMGGSHGGKIPPSLAIHLNRYNDVRYNVNQLVFFDCLWVDWIDELIAEFFANNADGEPRRVDNYKSTWRAPFREGVLNVQFSDDDHSLAGLWYRESANPDLTPFNSGIVAGTYWSVFGPGKNLHSAYTPGVWPFELKWPYEFKWYGTKTSGYMVLHEDCTICGRLPEPVTLVEPNGDNIEEGVLLTCQESQNAVGYQLLVGADPYRVMDFDVISDTPAPPTEAIMEVPEGAKYWTIKVRDQWGSTIHADPLHLPWRLTVDLKALAKYWLNRCVEPAWCDSCDIDHSGLVDFIDFAKFADHWFSKQ